MSLFSLFLVIAEQSSCLSLHSIHKRDTSENDGSSNTGDDEGVSGPVLDAVDSSQDPAPALMDVGGDSDVMALGDQFDLEAKPDGVASNAMAMDGPMDSDSGDGNRDDSSEGKKCSKCKNRRGTGGDGIGSDDSNSGSDDSNRGSNSDDSFVASSMGLNTGYGLNGNTGSDDSNSGSGSDDSNSGIRGVMGVGTGYNDLDGDIGNDNSNSGSDDDSNSGVRGIKDIGTEYGGLDAGTGSDDSNSGSGSDDSYAREGGIMIGRGNDDLNTDSDDSGEGTDSDDSGSGKKCSRCRNKAVMGELGFVEGSDDSGDGTGSDDTGSDSGEGRICDGIGCRRKCAGNGCGDDSQEGTGYGEGDSQYGTPVYAPGMDSDSDSGSGNVDGMGMTIDTNSPSSDSNENTGDDSQEGGDSSSGEDLGEGLQNPAIFDNIGEDRLATDLIMSEGRGSDINRIGLDKTNYPEGRQTDWPGVSPGDLYMESANNVPLPSDSTWRDPQMTPDVPGFPGPTLPGDQGGYIPGMPPTGQPMSPTPDYPGVPDPMVPDGRGQYIPGVPPTEQPTFIKPEVPGGMESISLNVAPSIEPTIANYIQPPDMTASIAPTPTPYQADQVTQNVPLEPERVAPTPGYDMNQGYESNQYTENIPIQPTPTDGYMENQYVDNIPPNMVSSSNFGGGMETIVDQTSPNLGTVHSERYANPPSTGGFVDLSIRGKGHLVDGGPVGIGGAAVGNYIQGPNEVKTWSDSTQSASSGVIELFHNSGKTHGLKKICVHIRQGPVDAQSAAIQARQHTGGLKTLLKTILHDGVVTSERVVNQHGDATGKLEVNIPDGSVDVAGQIGNEFEAARLDNQMAMDARYSEVNSNRVPQSFINEPREIMFTQDAMRRRPSRIFLAISSKMKEADRAIPFNPIAREPIGPMDPMEPMGQMGSTGQMGSMDQLDQAQNGKGVIRVYTSQPDGSKTMKRVFVNLRQPSPVTIRRTIKIPLTRTFSTGRDGSVSIGFGGGNSVVGARDSGRRLSGSVTGEMMRVDGGGHFHDGHHHSHSGHGHEGHAHSNFRDQTFGMGGQRTNEVTLPGGRFHIHKIGDRNVVHDHHHGNVDRDTYRRVMELLNRRLPTMDPTLDPITPGRSVEGIPIHI